MFIHLSSLYTHELIHLYSSQIPIRRSSQTFIRPHLVFLLLLIFYTRVRDKTLSLCLLLRSTGWRESYFFTCPILFWGHGLLSRIANHPLRRSHFHSSENALSKPWLCIIRLIATLNVFWTAVPCYLECCSSWIGTLFHLSWNRIPS